MATKAELEAELAALKDKLAETVAEQKPAAPETSQPPLSFDADTLKSKLIEAGLDTDDIEAVWDQLSAEVGTLQQKNPMLTLVGVFALGFMLGRLSK